MIYLDYSATTPVNKIVLDEFNRACLNYIGNPNSMHKLGRESFDAISKATSDIASLFNVKNEEIIYTSGASESNNMAIKGICNGYKKYGKHIITSTLEHSSVIAPISYLQKEGFEVDFIKLNSDGSIDLEHFKSLLRDDTVLVSLSSVNSEVGLVLNIEEIGEILKSYPNAHFHVDITQSVGKKLVDLTNVDTASLSAQKFYGLKGIGLLIKKEDVKLEPLIHGGKSTTIYRSGTPALPLILSLNKALVLAFDSIDNKYRDVLLLNNMIVSHISKYDKVFINSPKGSIPHILNMSIKGVKASLIQEEFEKHDVYLSTQTACSLDTAPSASVYVLTNDIDRANSSIRISLSYLTTEDEVREFLDIFDLVYACLVHDENN